MAGAEEGVALTMYALCRQGSACGAEVHHQLMALLETRELAKEYRVGDNVVHALRGVRSASTPASS